MGKRRTTNAKLETISGQLRLAIDEENVSRYEIARQNGVSEATLSKFIHGQRGLSLDSIDRLGEYLGLRIVVDPKSAKRGNDGKH